MKEENARYLIDRFVFELVRGFGQNTCRPISAAEKRQRGIMQVEASSSGWLPAIAQIHNLLCRGEAVSEIVRATSLATPTFFLGEPTKEEIAREEKKVSTEA